LVLALNRWNDLKSSGPLLSESSDSASQKPFFSDVGIDWRDNDEARSRPDDDANAVMTDDSGTTRREETDRASGRMPLIKEDDKMNGSNGDETPRRVSELPESRKDRCDKYLLVDDNKINVQV
jgi:hypothetical protein